MPSCPKLSVYDTFALWADELWLNRIKSITVQSKILICDYPIDLYMVENTPPATMVTLLNLINKILIHSVDESDFKDVAVSNMGCYQGYMKGLGTTKP